MEPAPGEADPDVWVIVFRALPDRVPAVHRVKRLLKRAGDMGLKAVRIRDGSPAEDGRLQALVQALCERVLAQKEILEKRAEKGD